MSIGNLTTTGKKLGDLYTRKLEKSQKDPFRASLQMYRPQVAAQKLSELKKEIKELKKPHKSKLKNGEEYETLPVLTLDEKVCIDLFKTIFNSYKETQRTKTFAGKKLSTDGILLDKAFYKELMFEAQQALKGKDWLIAPCLHLDSYDSNVKKKYADELAKLEISNRTGTDRRTDATEESFISKRLTGFQGSKVQPVGGSGWEEYRPGEGLTDYERTQTGIQLGHGDEGQPTFGYKMDEAKRIINEAKGLDAEDKRRLIDKISRKQEELGVQVQHKEHVDLKTGMKKGYTFLLFTGQRTAENVKDQKEEVSKGIEAADWMVEQILGDHRSRLDKTIGGLILNKLTKNNKGVKNTSKRHKAVEKVRSNEKTPKKKHRYKRKQRLVIGSGGAFAAQEFAKKVTTKEAKPTRKPTKSTTPSVSSVGSPMQLLALFNANLEQRIRSNMGEPALVNRTGRFAGSVKVLNITPVPGTSGNIQYGYQSDPYQIFEGDSLRDPRLLIDKTLREQAAEMALGKFTTTRI